MECTFIHSTLPSSATRIRTLRWRSQSPLPYRLAIALCFILLFLCCFVYLSTTSLIIYYVFKKCKYFFKLFSKKFSKNPQTIENTGFLQQKKILTYDKNTLVNGRFWTDRTPMELFFWQHYNFEKVYVLDFLLWLLGSLIDKLAFSSLA